MEGWLIHTQKWMIHASSFTFFHHLFFFDIFDRLFGYLSSLHSTIKIIGKKKVQDQELFILLGMW